MSPWPDRGRWLEYSVAILLGNAIYFLLLVPLLPQILVHKVFTIDLGLALDFLLCVGILVLIHWRKRG